MNRISLLGLGLAMLLAVLPVGQTLAGETVNDVTRLNPVSVEAVVTPTSVGEISRIVGAHNGPISIGGARHSQGGQTACTGCLFVDMRHFNHVLSIDAKQHLITVEAGTTWRARHRTARPADPAARPAGYRPIAPCRRSPPAHRYR